VGESVCDNNQKVIKMAKKKKSNKGKYTTEFKREVMAYRQNHSITKTAARFGIPKGTVSTWSRQWGHLAGIVQEAETPPQPDKTDVLLEVAELALSLRKRGHKVNLKVEDYEDSGWAVLSVKQ